MNTPNPNDLPEPAENPYPNGPTKGFLPGKSYDKLKQIALVILPALSTLYFTLGNIWGFPHVEQVIGTIAALDVFLGVLLGLASASYRASDARFAGDIVVQQTPEGGKVFDLQLNGDHDDLWLLDRNKELTFKVRSES